MAKERGHKPAKRPTSTQKALVRLQSAPGSKDAQVARSPQNKKIRRLIRKGWSSGEIAAALAPGDEGKNPAVRRKRKSIRAMVNRIIAVDEEIGIMKGLAAKGELIGNMDEIAEAVARRAARGNIPAAKLAMEASGFHSPKTTHDHTGEIGITIKHAARPTPTVDEGPVVDATVVDD